VQYLGVLFDKIQSIDAHFVSMNTCNTVEQKLCDL